MTRAHPEDDFRPWYAPTRGDKMWARDWALFFLGAVFARYPPWGWAAYGVAMFLTVWTRTKVAMSEEP